MPARLLSVAAALVLAGTSSLQAQSGAAFEVWTADQNANVLYVLDADGKVLRTLDSAALGNARRPHMLQGARGDAYVYIANTVSGSVTVLDRSDGAVKAVVSGVGKSPHAAQPNPAHPDRIYVMNIGPQALGPDGRPDRGETIAEVTRSGSPPAWRISRTIDLKAQPVLADSAKFPSRRPVYGGFSKDGRLMLVTLFNGGLAVVDLDEWKVTKAWGKRDIGQYGAFATMPEGNELYVTSGDMTSSWLYVIDVSGAEPQLVVRHDLSSRGQDAHGLHIDPVRRELWIAHRVSGTITIHPLATVRNAGHEIRVLSGFGKTPDMIAFSPDHSRAYVTLRGPKPAPTIPHATVGEAPGVAIIDVAGRRVMQVVKLGIQETGDFHGIFVPGSN